MKPLSYKAFWEWFTHHQNELLAFEGTKDSIYGELINQLSQIHPDLFFEMGPVSKRGHRVVILSANGITEAKAEVLALLESAPTLPGFQFQAFREREGLANKTIALGEVSFGYEDLYFLYADEGKKIGLCLFIRGYEDENSQIKNVIFLLLDSLIGEQDAMEYIAWLEWEVLDEKNKDQYSPITDLVALVDEKKEG